MTETADAADRGTPHKLGTAAHDLLAATGLGDHVDDYERGGAGAVVVACGCLVASRCGKKAGARAIRALLSARPPGGSQAP